MVLLMLQLSTKLTEMRLKTTEEEALSKYEGTKTMKTDNASN